jgi:serine/threonine-protein kinase
MLSPDGSVKVMDFGIAKANNATSSTMTATQAVIGTAQYLSPEQAQGKKVDARSDVYSTGVLFYELLTGEPPFRGDNPVAVAYQHVREIPDPPSRHNPQLSAAADAVTLHALEKEADDRYASAGEMRDDLERALAGRRVVAQQSGRPTAGGAAAATQIAGRGGYRDDPRTGGYDTYDRYGDTGYQDSGYEPGAYRQSGETRTRGGYAPVGGYTDQFERFPPDDDRYGGSGGAAPPPQRGSNAWKWVLAGLAVVLTFVVVSLVATSLLSNKGGGSGSGGSAGGEATIPKGLTGQTVTVVKNNLTDAGFTNFQLTPQTVTDGTAADTVLKISPAEGSTVPKSTTINLTVARAPDQVSVPNVIGQTATAATAALEEALFQVKQLPYSGSNPPTQKAGRVEQTDPAAGAPAGKGTTVTIYVVSSQVNVGSYIGQSVSSAQAALTQLGLNNTVQQQPSDQAPGTVIDQNPKNATVNRGDTITLVVAAQATSSPTGTPSTGVTPTLPGLPTSGGTGGPGHGGGTATPSPTG